MYFVLYLFELLLNLPKQVRVFFDKQATQKVQADLLHDDGPVPDASPEEFAVIGSMSRASQGLAQAVNGCAVTDGDGYNHRPKVMSGRFGELCGDRFEKTLESSGNRADGNHKASRTMSLYHYNTYRQSRPLFFANNYHQLLTNRSV